MPTPIHPAALKRHRDLKRWTQEQLSEATKGKNKVSLPTIKRIESAKGGAYLANDRVAEGLMKALGVKADELSKPPADDSEIEASLLEAGYRPLRTMLDSETALAFNLVQHLYGIPIRSQIVMAPLFAALLAEASLAWRRERVAEIEAAAATLMSLGGGHFSFAYSAHRAEEGASREKECIEKRDLFGTDVWDDTYDLGYDPSVNNPFADFLKHFASEVGARTVSFEGNRISSSWKTSEGMPDYRIGADLITELTGDDPDADYALRRGHVKLRDLLARHRQEQQSDRIAWIVSQIPAEELARRKAEREDLLSMLGDFELPDAAVSPGEGTENDNG